MDLRTYSTLNWIVTDLINHIFALVGWEGSIGVRLCLPRKCSQTDLMLRRFIFNIKHSSKPQAQVLGYKTSICL